MPRVTRVVAYNPVPIAPQSHNQLARIEAQGVGTIAIVQEAVTNKKDARSQAVSAAMNEQQEYERNCRACEAVYAEPAKRKKCKEIAKILRDKKNEKDYVAYIPEKQPCACNYPDFPTGEICMWIYDQAVNSSDPDVRNCAAECFVSCVLWAASFLETTEGR